MILAYSKTLITHSGGKKPENCEILEENKCRQGCVMAKSRSFCLRISCACSLDYMHVKNMN